MLLENKIMHHLWNLSFPNTLVIKLYVLANIVIIAFVSVGGLRSPALPHQGQSGLEKWCADHRMGWHHCIDPPYVLVSTPDQRMDCHILWRSHGYWWGPQAGSRQAGSQAVRGRQDDRTGDTVRSNLPRKIDIFNLETCSEQTWLSSTLPLSISSTVHSSFPKVFNSFIFSFMRTSAWSLAVPLCRWSQQIKTLFLLMTKSKAFRGISAPTLVHLVFRNITSLHSLHLCSPL